MRPTRRFLLSLAATASVGAALAAGLLPSTARSDAVLAEDGLALSGYDPVAYFTAGEPRAGDPAMHADWGGARWLFESAANRDAFLANPDAYAPQFGGYCAWAVAEGDLAPIDPEAWRIEGGKLYLNYSQRIQARWEADIPGNIARAEANWPGLAD